MLCMLCILSYIIMRHYPKIVIVNLPCLFINLARASDNLGRPQDMKKYLAKAARLNPALADNPAIQKILRS